MGNYTFEQVPFVLGKIEEQLNRIEALLLKNGDPNLNRNDLLTIHEAAHYLNLKVSTIYSKVCRREIPVCKKGKRLYFSNSDLDKWILSGKKKTNEELAVESGFSYKKLEKKRYS